MTQIKIGVVGYLEQKFDKTEAGDLIAGAFDAVAEKYPDRMVLPGRRGAGGFEKVVVSGLTDLGIPALAYREAEKRGWRTIGIACKKAKDFKCFPVYTTHIVGEEWGDESETFLNSIDILVRVGGGKQSLKEASQFKKMDRPTIEYELEAQK